MLLNNSSCNVKEQIDDTVKYALLKYIVNNQNRVAGIMTARIL